MLVALAEADQLNDIRVIGSTHDLNFFEDVCALHRWKQDETSQSICHDNGRRKNEEGLGLGREHCNQRPPYSPDMAGRWWGRRWGNKKTATNLRNPRPFLEVWIQVLVAILVLWFARIDGKNKSEEERGNCVCQSSGRPFRLRNMGVRCRRWGDMTDSRCFDAHHHRDDIGFWLRSPLHSTKGP